MESILDSIKQALGESLDNTNFDQEIIMHINGALSIITQLGVGSVSGMFITDNTQTWYELIGARKDLEFIKTNVFLRTKLVFDPPQNSFLVASIEKQIGELDWRIEAQHLENTGV